MATPEHALPLPRRLRNREAKRHLQIPWVEIIIIGVLGTIAATAGYAVIEKPWFTTTEDQQKQQIVLAVENNKDTQRPINLVPEDIRLATTRFTSKGIKNIPGDQRSGTAIVEQLGDNALFLIDEHEVDGIGKDPTDKQVNTLTSSDGTVTLNLGDVVCEQYTRENGQTEDLALCGARIKNYDEKQNVIVPLPMNRFTPPTQEGVNQGKMYSFGVADTIAPYENNPSTSIPFREPLVVEIANPRLTGNAIESTTLISPGMSGGVLFDGDTGNVEAFNRQALYFDRNHISTAFTPVFPNLEAWYNQTAPIVQDLIKETE